LSGRTIPYWISEGWRHTVSLAYTNAWLEKERSQEYMLHDRNISEQVFKFQVTGTLGISRLQAITVVLSTVQHVRIDFKRSPLWFIKVDVQWIAMHTKHSVKELENTELRML
jgi:hypothetical protein